MGCISKWIADLETYGRLEPLFPYDWGSRAFINPGYLKVPRGIRGLTPRSTHNQIGKRHLQSFSMEIGGNTIRIMMGIPLELFLVRLFWGTPPFCLAYSLHNYNILHNSCGVAQHGLLKRIPLNRHELPVSPLCFFSIMLDLLPT